MSADMDQLQGMQAKAKSMASAVAASLPEAIPWSKSYHLPTDLKNYARLRIVRVVAAGVVMLWCASVFGLFASATKVKISLPSLVDGDVLDRNSTERLPLIPPNIYQIFLGWEPDKAKDYSDNILSWIGKSPSYSYTLLDDEGAQSIVSKLAESSTHAHILPVFYAMGRRVMRVDFLRYLLLALEGGVYSDIDTELLKPVHDWVPKALQNSTRLIVGIEADHSPPIAGTTYETQFCQWTLAGAPGHPVLWRMVDKVLDTIRTRPFSAHSVDYSNDEVLGIGGPAGWTETIYEYLSDEAGEPVTWRNLTGMTEPKLFGDVLVLPIDGFASNVGHSGSHGDQAPGAMVKHHFKGSWRGGN
ncbi:unnamed protein product [Zymoseptoria tritici ST99CH_1A5]|uniref:Initiation-specific alpha-1,6-mannosyltransferase n=4 Tax=Zymoseptoria tritici TaxID=1047171 RepID=F9X7H8_ZYMTI|nr:uncharacterized protein MYCGRDRAFT_103966 [Zymoseptoria tritici IPO323]EGP89102.1 hypothetical protein MYCGRDRAFT_103966 [Zymoseptoria tritici IPO323]SMQ49434.1 unnamed protein product [Zymoseptoria tritici ST99CH_3D7]SMR49258.1 unnamed protein product [Zymoseptoria tritici ST99CH_1E4]SMY23127.1 unnamed protein product [Zymoseptoria tritici ST99CH_1A5]